MVQSYVVVKKGINHHCPIVLYMIVVYLLCHIQLFNPSVANKAPLSMEFPSQAYWSGLPFSSQRDLPDTGIESGSPMLQAVSCIAGGFFTDWATGEAHITATQWDIITGIVAKRTVSVLIGKCMGKYKPPIPTPNWFLQRLGIFILLLLLHLLYRCTTNTPILWPPDVKNWLTGKDPDVGKDWRWEKGTTEDEMVGWYHQLNGHEFGYTLELVMDK